MFALMFTLHSQYSHLATQNVGVGGDCAYSVPHTHLVIAFNATVCIKCGAHGKYVNSVDRFVLCEYRTALIDVMPAILYL